MSGRTGSRPRRSRPPGQERPDEEPALLGRRGALEDQRGAHPHDAQPAVAHLDGIEQPLHRRLVHAVGRARDARPRPRLVDEAILRALRVHPDRRGHDEPRDAGCHRRLDHPAGAEHVRAPEAIAVARRLDLPGEVHDGIGAVEHAGQVVVRDVELREAPHGEARRRGPAARCRSTSSTPGAAASACTSAVPTLPVAPVMTTRMPRAARSARDETGARRLPRSRDRAPSGL